MPSQTKSTCCVLDHKNSNVAIAHNLEEVCGDNVGASIINAMSKIANRQSAAVSLGEKSLVDSLIYNLDQQPHSHTITGFSVVVTRMANPSVVILFKSSRKSITD